MNLWIISIVRSIDFLCNILFYISLFCILFNFQNMDDDERSSVKKVFFTSLFGVIFIPSKEALQAMLG